MKQETKNNVMKWVMFVSFGLVLVGGLNMLLMGMFNLNLIGSIFGGASSAGARVIWSMIGLGAVALLVVVLVKAFSQKDAPRQKQIEA
ncbi:MAG: DUF378 domain-containing protein [Firmicutes bacterium]|nr:DUF378 domain-containing protein [Bacillota bacterium]